jgi:hypothetical protein
MVPQIRTGLNHGRIKDFGDVLYALGASAAQLFQRRITTLPV